MLFGISFLSSKALVCHYIAGHLLHESKVCTVTFVNLSVCVMLGEHISVPYSTEWNVKLKHLWNA